MVIYPPLSPSPSPLRGRGITQRFVDLCAVKWKSRNTYFLPISFSPIPTVTVWFPCRDPPQIPALLSNAPAQVQWSVRLFYEEDINIRTQELRQTIPAKLGAFHRLHHGSKYPNIQRNEATWPGDNILSSPLCWDATSSTKVGFNLCSTSVLWRRSGLGRGLGRGRARSWGGGPRKYAANSELTSWRQ